VVQESTVQIGPILRVGDDSAVVRLHPGSQGGSVDFRGGDVNRVVVPKECPSTRKLEKDRRVLRADEIRAQSVPDDYHDVLGLALGLRFVPSRQPSGHEDQKEPVFHKPPSRIPQDGRDHPNGLTRDCAIQYESHDSLVRNTHLKVVQYAPRLWSGIYSFIDHSSALDLNLAGFSRLRTELKQTIDRTEPDCVVSTYPSYGQILAQLYRDHRDPPFRFVTVITDSISVNSIWFKGRNDFYCVANRATSDVLRQAGIPAAQVRDLELPDVRLTITVGRDAWLKAKLMERTHPCRDRVHILGWTNQMPALMRSHHLVIGKAGGATVQEAIAARCPIIVNQIIPGQEEGNAQLIRDAEGWCSSIIERPPGDRYRGIGQAQTAVRPAWQGAAATGNTRFRIGRFLMARRPSVQLAGPRRSSRGSGLWDQSCSSRHACLWSRPRGTAPQNRAAQPGARPLASGCQELVARSGPETANAPRAPGRSAFACIYTALVHPVQCSDDSLTSADHFVRLLATRVHCHGETKL
jgi:Monogalactosyldiacylglycerol (MGDG) synthase